MLPEHLLPKQVLAERDMKKGAWRGLGDKVVREFDSVFSAHKQQGKHMKPGAHHAPKVSLLCATQCSPAATHARLEQGVDMGWPLARAACARRVQSTKRTRETSS